MPKLSPEGLRAVADIAQRTGFSPDAVTSMLLAVIAGAGGMAQFSHPEFGGSGQWMSGGAIMLSDMFNNTLKARVDALCGELSALVKREPGLAVAGSFQSQSQGGAVSFGGGQSSLLTPDASGGTNWWPADLGAPASVGAQNATRYAYFPVARRLAIGLDGKVTVYDTQDHQISGFSQQQSGSGSFTFMSQHGTVDVGRLPRVSGGSASPPPSAAGPATPAAAVSATPAAAVSATPAAAASPTPAAAGSGAAPAGHGEILGVIEKLADLRAKGILTEDEFSAKKAELLSRL